jgi:hypothetical protein
MSVRPTHHDDSRRLYRRTQPSGGAADTTTPTVDPVAVAPGGAIYLNRNARSE